MITQWIMANLEKIAVLVIMIPMGLACAIGVFFSIDGHCKSYKWYGRIMYGSVDRDDEYADEFFGKAFLSLGVVNILLPFIVVYSYLYITGKTISDLWLSK